METLYLFHVSAKSQVYSHVSSTLYGVTTIRAFRAEDKFENKFYEAQDIHSAAWRLCLATGRWMDVFSELMCVVYIGLVSITLVEVSTGKDEILYYKRKSFVSY